MDLRDVFTLKGVLFKLLQRLGHRLLERGIKWNIETISHGFFVLFLLFL